MTKRPKLSIVIPTYNEINYIADCLDSILHKQNYLPEEIEIIISDNNSQDETLALVQNYNVTIVHNNKPGAAATRNAGAQYAKGDYIYFLDADCRVGENHIQSLLNYICDNPHVTVLSGPIIYDRDGSIPHFVTKNCQYYTFYFWLMKSITGIQSVSGGNLLIKKETFLSIAGFNETFNNQKIIYPDDLELAIRIHQQGKANVVYSRLFPIYSSFRRVKHFPHHTIYRAFAACKLISSYLIKKVHL